MRPKNQEPIQIGNHSEMALEKCNSCELVINRSGEKRPAIKCKDCKEKFCFRCANLEAVLCQMMRDAGREFWACGACESKNADLKSVIDSIQNIQTEISTIKKGQDEQQGERERVLEGLKMVETVVKKMDKIESVQADHEDRLTAQELAKKKSDEKMDAGLKRLEEVEKKLSDGALQDKRKDGTSDIRLTNAVVREVREIEKRERNFMVWNIPESTEEAEEDRKKYDEKNVIDILRELKLEDVSLKEIARMGEKGGRFPRKIRVILTSAEDCQRVLQKSESAQLSNNVRLSRDKTFHERQEARLFWLEKEETQNEGHQAAPMQRGGVRGGVRGSRGGGGGGGRGRSSGRGAGRRGGRGGSARGGLRSESRKRRNSGGDVTQTEAEEDENKRRRVEQNTQNEVSESVVPARPQSLLTSTEAGVEASATPPQASLQSVEGRPGTPHPRLAARAVEQPDF